MVPVSSASAAEPSRPARVSGIDKIERRRVALAESALKTLGELGYARTSLREIANNSEFTHGVVHYYFADKFELIIYCVKQYKATCVTRYDGVVAESMNADELVDAFVAKLRETIVDEAPMHRLWYDLRSQSMFEESLREAVQQIDTTLADMVWRVICRYAEVAGTDVAASPHLAYSVLDGLFQSALLGYLCGREGALDELETEVRAAMPLMLAGSR